MCAYTIFFLLYKMNYTISVDGQSFTVDFKPVCVKHWCKLAWEDGSDITYEDAVLYGFNRDNPSSLFATKIQHVVGDISPIDVCVGPYRWTYIGTMVLKEEDNQT